jgi:DNA-directed RNA polymerase beta subunit
MTESESVYDASVPSAADDVFVPVGVNGLLAATQKTLAMNRGLLDEDHRDGIQYKRLMMTHDLMAERVKMDTGHSFRRAMMHAAKNRSLNGFMSGALDPMVKGHIVQSSLSSPSEEINPVDVLNQTRRVTLLGPGGISGSDMITPDMSAVHASIFGFLSPVEGPESSTAGVDTRLAHGVMLGTNGRLYQKFKDKAGNTHWLSPEDLRGKVIGLPGAE